MTNKSAAQVSKNICDKCKCEITERFEICLTCEGSGLSDDDMDFHGCLSCNKGEVIFYDCECDPYEDLE